LVWTRISCTPSYSIAGGYAHTYLKESIRDFVPFEKITPDMSFVDKIIEEGARRKSKEDMKRVEVRYYRR